MRHTTVQSLGWQPPPGYDLAIEAMTISEVRRRGSPEFFARPYRLDFFLLLAVTRGRARHVVDFETLTLGPGTWLLLRPGQMQRFFLAGDWSGFLVAFRPDSLPPGHDPLRSAEHALSTELEEVLGRIHLSREQHEVCCATVRQMRRDAALVAPARDRNALLLHQLFALLFRLRLADAPAGSDTEPAQRARVAALRLLLERHLREHRDVAWYADALHCSPKTLTRAVRALTGLTAKALISARVALEIKRLLVHSELPVAEIADTLAFDEASNFVKFFRRQTGCAPSAFRDRHGD